MEKIKLNCFSQTLQKKVEIIIFGNLENIQTIIIGLHGLGGDKYDLLDKTNLYSLVEQYNKTCVLVDGQRSFYINSTYGENYYDFIQTELLNILEKYLKIKTEETEKYIFGFSMGGYGALNYFLEDPKKYKGIGTIAGAFDMPLREEDQRNTDDLISLEWKKIFKNIKNAQKHDVYRKVKTNKNLIKNQKIFISCGTEDYLYKYSQQMSRTLTENKIQYHQSFTPGSHNYKYVNESIKEMFKYFFN